MNSHQTLSTYLVRPDLTPKRHRSWAGFSTRMVRITRSNPRIVTRGLLALLIWTGVFAAIHYATNPPDIAASSGVASLAQAAAVNKTTPSTLTKAAPVAQLASSPAAGQAAAAAAQPPAAIAVAPARTYANSYAPGQCTWYVASRRPIPNGWGNAKSWYSHAAAAGWKVGATPAVGAVAWTSAGWAGHVAIVEQVSTDGRVYIAEMNYYGPYTTDHRWVSASSFKYIY
jgi:surface antigen